MHVLQKVALATPKEGKVKGCPECLDAVASILTQPRFQPANSQALQKEKRGCDQF